jgi:hypothetical protein
MKGVVKLHLYAESCLELMRCVVCLSAFEVGRAIGDLFLPQDKSPQSARHTTWTGIFTPTR